MTKLNTIELFSGTGSFSNVAKDLGHNIYRVDNNKKFMCEEYANLLEPLSDQLKNKIDECDVIWMSPPCNTFSLASGNKHWTFDKEPRTLEAKKGYNLLKICENIAHYCMLKNKIFFIENPNGRAVWFLPNKWLKRVWYCQYGDTRAKPTNIWTNLNINFKTCKNNNPFCNHIRAKRGSKTGTQGLKNCEERGIIPSNLIYYIFEEIKHK